MKCKKISETSQVFNIECVGVQITETLLKSLLRQYFGTIGGYIKEINVIEVLEEKIIKEA